jgi:hypothetical protein
MTLLNFLNSAGNIQEYSRKSHILLFAYYLRQHQGVLEFSSAEIRDCFKQSLLKVPSDLTSLLKEMTKGRNSPLMKGAQKRSGSYALARPGQSEVEAYFTAKEQTKEQTETEVDSLLKSAIPYLEKIIAKVSDSNQRKFLAESIACLGVDAKRATIIMTWAGTIAHLYDYILHDQNRINDFNSAIQKRSDKYNKVVIADYDDFSDVPESVFIEVCRSAKLITNDVRKILDEKLGIRNTCAHPSGVEIHKTKVINFIEDLSDNIIIKYKIK